MGAAATGVWLNHISRATPDVKRLAKFYEEVLGFERIESPNFGDFDVIWLKLPSASFALHLIERNPLSSLPEGPSGSTAEIAAADPKHLPRGHHLSFAISNYDSFIESLKGNGVKVFEKTQPDGKTKQAFFFDPDGNGLEVGTWVQP
ncbi:glyoxylase I 4-like [Magnolia sinica]|uniref:glyoxylase I 4-like n=1 Tax=Magnolia sinica TaxID=86752 RepID=UPI002657CEAA|nr:glyoxylase I 4-like [Magnolia sinica]